MEMNSRTIVVCLMILGFRFTDGLALKLNVVTTLPSLASITEEMGRDHINVFSITRGAQDAHYIDAKPSYMVKLHKADLLIYSGLELEIGWLPLLIQGARNDEVSVGSRGNLNASIALSVDEILEKPRGEIDRSMGDVHPAGNPHYLLDPYNGIRVADLIAQRLAELDPENKIFYRQNFDRFKTKLEEKIHLFEQKAKDLKGMDVVCYHVHWSYLLDWLGIHSAGYIELRPGIPPTPQHKKEIIQLMQEKRIKIVIISSWKEPTKAQEVASEVGGHLIILPGEVNALEGAGDYISWIGYMIDHLVDIASRDDQDIEEGRRIKNRERKRGVK